MPPTTHPLRIFPTKDFARKKFKRITNPHDANLPQYLIRDLGNNIETILPMKAFNTYPHGAISALHAETYLQQSEEECKHKCFLLHPPGPTGGIVCDDFEIFEIYSTYLNPFSGQTIPRNGNEAGIRLLPHNFLEQNLQTLKFQIQTERGEIVHSEGYLCTQHSIFMGPNNEQKMIGWTPINTYAKVCNLSKFLSGNDNRPLVAKFENMHKEYSEGNNELAYGEKKCKSSSGEEFTTQYPKIILKCVAIDGDEVNGFRFFYQFEEIEMMRFWYTFGVPEVLSQFTTTARTCVAFVAFLEYYGYAPCHGISCKIHTRFKLPNQDWNNNIGYFKISRSGIPYSYRNWMNVITRVYQYRLENGFYPQHRREQEPRERDPVEERSTEILRILDRLSGRFHGMNTIDAMDIYLGQLRAFEESLQEFEYDPEEMDEDDWEMMEG